MARGRHQKKEIEKALEVAEEAGFTVTEAHRGHVWGHVAAPNGQRLTVWSTPRSPGTLARRIREFVRRHQK